MFEFKNGFAQPIPDNRRPYSTEDRWIIRGSVAIAILSLVSIGWSLWELASPERVSYLYSQVPKKSIEEYLPSRSNRLKKPIKIPTQLPVKSQTSIK